MSNRLLRKGKAPRTQTGKPNPLDAAGIDGDIRIVETTTGPKLKVRSNGKWWAADLYDESQTQTAGFTPRVWADRGVTGSAGSTTLITPPAYVTNNTIISVNMGISLGTNERTYFSLGDTGALAKYDMMVHYNKLYKYIRVQIFAYGGVSSVAGKDYTLAVFYEDKKER